MQLRSRIHHVAQFHFVHGRCDDHVRDAPHVSEVVRSVVRWAVGADYATAVQTENNVQVLDRHVVDDLVVGALHETRVDVAERHLALGGHAGTEGDGVLFSNAHVKARSGISASMYFNEQPDGIWGTPTTRASCLASSMMLCPNTS